MRVSLLHGHPLRVADRSRESLVRNARCVVRGVANLTVARRSAFSFGKACTAGVPSSRNGAILAELSIDRPHNGDVVEVCSFTSNRTAFTAVVADPQNGCIFYLWRASETLPLVRVDGHAKRSSGGPLAREGFLKRSCLAPVFFR